MEKAINVVNKPKVFFESRGESGNIFALLGKVSQALNDDKSSR